MQSEPVKRKLAAILSADVKGYSRLMGQDEAATVDSIRDCRGIMAAEIEVRNGRVVDAPGDNVLAEFGSAVNAVTCAVAIQDALENRNASVPRNREMVFRIGINIGDVIVEGQEIYGDGVNIAARLEGLADPGGICISGTLYDQVKRKVPFKYDFMGLQSVKNISEPVRAYRVLWKKADISGAKAKKMRHVGLRKGPGLFHRIILTCFFMLLLMPFVNHFNINLLTKMWQCRLTLLPNSHQVTVVTIDRDEYRKMNMKKGEKPPPPFDKRPKMWRRYNPTVIKNLFEMGAGAVGFDFWYSPANDLPEKKATQQFVEALKWSKEKKFPIIVGQYQNTQDKAVYDVADWGFISVYRDLTWIDKVMFLKSWDKMSVMGKLVAKPGFFVQVLADKLGLKPVLETGGVRLIGRPIPRRLWLAFAETPFAKVPYHEVYNGWADKKLFSDRIVLIGMGGVETDYFQVPYSPTDFTPDQKNDGYGMPGVFLFAHAINQVIQGYYYAEINDEWDLPLSGGGLSLFSLESILYLVMEVFTTCLLLHLLYISIRKKGGLMLKMLIMFLGILMLIALLSLIPVLFGLANFFFAGIIFLILCFRCMKIPEKN